MKNPMQFILSCIICTLLISCEKDNSVPGEDSGKTNYDSLKDFYAANEIKSQFFTVNSENGGTFTALQGTVITIPPDAFVTLADVPVTGDVSLEFREIYKKSDMVLSERPTILSDGRPLKSAGEFFIKASSNGAAVKLAPGNEISIELSSMGEPADPDMEAFTAVLNPFAWFPAGNIARIYDSIKITLYVSEFLQPEDLGTWYNSDNSAIFTAYQQTTLMLQQNDDPVPYETTVFLVFKDIDVVLPLYFNGSGFEYHYAPIGMNCTAVAIGIKDHMLYSSIIPITVESGQTFSFNMNQVTEEVLKNQLRSLD